MMNVIDDFERVTTFDYPYITADCAIEKKEQEEDNSVNIINRWLDDFGWL